jgi:hypothetical protein
MFITHTYSIQQAFKSAIQRNLIILSILFVSAYIVTLLSVNLITILKADETQSLSKKRHHLHGTKLTNLHYRHN